MHESARATVAARRFDPADVKRSLIRCVRLLPPLGTYLLSLAIVLLGVSFGLNFVASPIEAQRGRPAGVLDACSNWDGRWYERLIDEGYQFQSGEQSTAAFFPAYPLTAWAVAQATGLRTHVALLLTSNLCLIAAMLIAYTYFEDVSGKQVAQWSTASLALFPTTLFFRMAYTESMMLLVTSLVLLGCRRGWPLLGISLLAGFGSAIRAVGVGLLAPLAVSVRRRQKGHHTWIADVVLYGVVGCWGILVLANYMGGKFGDPLAFAKAHQSWHVRPSPPLLEKAATLLMLGPVREAFSLDHEPKRHNPLRQSHPVFNLHQANPANFLLVIGVLVLGAVNRWIDGCDIALAGAFLMIPYLFHAYETDLMSMGRFTSIVLPFHLVVGNILVRLPAAVAASLLGIASFLLGTYSALFAAGFPIL